MTDTNIPALLEELREVEPLLWETITYLDQGNRVIKFAYQVLDDFALDHLQGCIQRAIAAHSHEYMAEWFWEVAYEDHGRYEAKIYRREGLVTKEIADAPAAAILAAYIEAKRAMQ